MKNKHYPALRFRKTNTAERGSYTYEFADGQRVTIAPGTDDVTEIDIKALHRLDDHEVYISIRSSRPSLTPEEKETLREWRGEHSGSETPPLWTVSLDAMLTSRDDEDDDQRTGFLRQAEYHAALAEQAVSDPTERMREIMEAMSERRQLIYRLVMLSGLEKTAVARMLGISEGMVRKEVKAITQAFASDPVLRSYFRGHD